MKSRALDYHAGSCFDLRKVKESEISYKVMKQTEMEERIRHQYMHFISRDNSSKATLYAKANINEASIVAQKPIGPTGKSRISQSLVVGLYSLGAATKIKHAP
jgi:hypothetical protein